MTSIAAELSDEQEEIKSNFRDEFGFWHDAFDYMLALDQEFVETFQLFIAHPWNNGPLPRKTKALICLAVNASPTLLNREGIRQYLHSAFKHGAEFDEVLDVFEQVTAIGNHAVALGVPVLIEEAGLQDEFTSEELQAQERIRDAFREKRGYWDDGKEPRLKIDPEHFERYLNLSAHPWENGVLDPKTRELIYIALNASATHIFEYGVTAHVQAALDQGATREEILEAFQLAASIGLHPISEGIPILVEVAREYGEL
jgi:AhpD family alkylhydroperoxidase